MTRVCLHCRQQFEWPFGRPPLFCCLWCYFWYYVSEPNEQGCCIWKGPRSGRRNGASRYGEVNFRGVSMRAHQVCLKLHGVELGPVNMHTCDNGLCVALEHVIPATQSENIQDSIDKWRFTQWRRE